MNLGFVTIPLLTGWNEDIMVLITSLLLHCHILSFDFAILDSLPHDRCLKEKFAVKHEHPFTDMPAFMHSGTLRFNILARGCQSNVFSSESIFHPIKQLMSYLNEIPDMNTE